MIPVELVVAVLDSGLVADDNNDPGDNSDDDDDKVEFKLINCVTAAETNDEDNDDRNDVS